ncbi:MAG TPA: porin [Verrucomicrobiae bacterium]|nr:porin [Verrucomicrobiae bacterium]
MKISTLEKHLSLALASLSLVGGSFVALAQPATSEERIQRLERAVKELQQQNEQLKKLSTNPPPAQPDARLAESAAAKKSGLWADHDVRFFWKEGLNFQSGDGKTFKGKIGGRLQYDVAGFEESDAVKATAGDAVTSTEFRRVRLYTSGEINQGIPVHYILQMEFAGGDVRFADAYLGVNKVPFVGLVQVGQMYEPFSLEQLTSDNYLTFMERAAPIEAFSPARNVGLLTMNTFFDERLTYAFGGFADDEPDDADAVPIESNARFTGRVTGLPWYDEASGGRSYLHLGVGGSVINPHNDTVRFRTRPEAHMAPRYVDTGAFATDMAYLANAEALLTFGPLSIQGEYFQNWNDSESASDPVFNGFYVFASYFLTGDYRPYRKSSGTVDRVRPKRNFSLDGSGFGAWELLARVSQVDLNDGSIRGGRLTDYTAGLGWYLNPNTRVLLNYVYADLSRNGQRGYAHIWEARAQVDF